MYVFDARLSRFLMLFSNDYYITCYNKNSNFTLIKLIISMYIELVLINKEGITLTDKDGLTKHYAFEITFAMDLKGAQVLNGTGGSSHTCEVSFNLKFLIS